MTDPFAKPSSDSGDPFGAPPTPAYGQPPAYGQAPGYGYPPPQAAPPPYGAPYGYPGQPGPMSNGFGTASLVLGILGVVLFWFPVVGLVLAVLALVFAVLGRRKVSRHQASNGGMAIAGLVLGILGTIGSLIVTVYVLTHAKQISDYSDCIQSAGDDPYAKQICIDRYRDDVSN